MSLPLTVYAKKVPILFGRSYNVEIYRDKEGTDRWVTFEWHRKARPRNTKSYRSKSVVINCYRYKLEWLD